VTATPTGGDTPRPVVNLDARRSGPRAVRPGDASLPAVAELPGGGMTVGGKIVCNFTLRIVGQLREDRGEILAVGKRPPITSYDVEVTYAGNTARLRVPLAEYRTLDWLDSDLGWRGLRYGSGRAGKDVVCMAAEALSPAAQERSVYAHTGWRLIDGRWLYLHAGGAIGADGHVEGVEADLTGTALESYALPELPAGVILADAVRASLSLLDAAPDPVAAVGLGQVYRAPLGMVDHTGFVRGGSGTHKSGYVAALLSHFAPTMTRSMLPGSFEHTANYLRELRFDCKDSLVVVDDYAPDAGQAVEHAKTLTGLMRTQGNSTGRGRLDRDGSKRAVHGPRGSMLVTGEDSTGRASAAARVVMCDLAPGDVPLTSLAPLTTPHVQLCRAAAMGAYVQWLAARPDGPTGGADALAGKLGDLARECMSDGLHDRTPAAVGQLAAGWQRWLAFTVDSGALTDTEARTLWSRVWRALLAAGCAQGAEQAVPTAAELFRGLLRAAVSGGNAHVATRDGGSPYAEGNYRAVGVFGWRFEGSLAEERPRPRGDRTGWVDVDAGTLWLDPKVAYAAAGRQARAEGDGLPISSAAVARALRESGWLAAVDQAPDTPDGKPGTLQLGVRIHAEGGRPRVWQVPLSFLTGDDDGPGTERSAAAPVPDAGPAPDLDALAAVQAVFPGAVVIESEPAESEPAEAAPVETTHVKAEPAEAAPVEAAPVEAAPVEAAPGSSLAVAKAALAAGEPLRFLAALEGEFAPTRKCNGRLRAPYLRPEMPGMTFSVGAVQSGDWSRPFKGDVLVLDRSGAYVSAASSVRVAHGKLEHTGEVEFDGAPGYYRVQVHPWHELDRLPHPLGEQASRADTAWVTAPTAALLRDLAAEGRWADLTVLDSYTSEPVPLAKWAAFINEMRREAIATYGRGSDEYVAVKTAYGQTLALMLGSTERGSMRRVWKCATQRPDWTHTIQAQATATLYRCTMGCLKAAPELGPVAIRNTDELVIPADALEIVMQAKTKSGRPVIDIDPEGIRLGTFKVKSGQQAKAVK